ncbi:MAG: hypothetical protein WAV76_10375 [Bacteroidota bacterium]
MFWKDFILGTVIIVIGLVIMWKNPPYKNVWRIGFIALFMGMSLIGLAIINGLN